MWTFCYFFEKNMILVAVVIVISIAAFFCCSVCRKGVYINSLLPGFMPNQTIAIRKHDPLVLTIHHDTLTVLMGRTINSAFHISKLKISVKHSQRKIYLSALEAMYIKSCIPLPNLNNSYSCLPEGDHFSNSFHVLLRKHKVLEPYLYEYYWRDPDKKTTKLEITLCNIRDDNLDSSTSHD